MKEIYQKPLVELWRLSNPKLSMLENFSLYEEAEIEGFEDLEDI